MSGHPLRADHPERSAVDEALQHWSTVDDGPAALMAGRPGQPLIVAGPIERLVALASVTKPLVAAAVLVAAEDGSLDLDEPIDTDGATMRHLLSHSAGWRGVADPVGTRRRPVGTRRIYSNVGYDEAATILVERSGLPWQTHCDEVWSGLLDPAGVASSSAFRFDGTPGAGALGSVHGLFVAASAWAQPGALISATTWAAATAAFLPDLTGVVPGFGRFDPCPWGLGPEVKGPAKGRVRPHWMGTALSPSSFGHFGQSGAFMWIDPVSGMVAAASGRRPFGPWAAELWPRLNDALVAELASLAP